MVALWPVALFQASIVSVDPVINSISFLLFALLIKYWHQKDGTLSIAQAILPVLLISILAVTKQPYILLFIPFLFIPNRIFSSKRRAFICKAFWVLVPILAAIIWLEIDKSNSLQAMNIGGVNFTKQLDFVLHDPLRFIGVILNTFFQAADGYFGSMVGEIGDRMIGISIIYLAILSCLTVGIASILSKDQDKKSRDIVSSKKNISVILVVAIGIIGAISLSLYLGFTPVGASIIEGIQGRYFLPLIPFLGLALAPLIPLKLTVKKERAVLIMTTSSIFLLIITAALYTIVNY
jgi:uncharacterized membrane protein